MTATRIHPNPHALYADEVNRALNRIDVTTYAITITITTISIDLGDIDGYGTVSLHWNPGRGWSWAVTDAHGRVQDPLTDTDELYLPIDADPDLVASEARDQLAFLEDIGSTLTTIDTLARIVGPLIRPR